MAEPIPIRPTVHYTMGGVTTDVEARTEMPGVFAAGECACVSVHGANRLGGNSLLDTIVFGRRAGRHAAAQPRAGTPCSAAAAGDEHARLEALLARGSGERPAVLRREMEQAMRAAFGLFKNEAAMRQGLQALVALRGRAQNLLLEDKGTTFNHDLFLALQLENLLDAAWLCAASSIPRTESRGCHYRTDYPRIDNARFLKHTLVRRQPDGDLTLSYADVRIEDVQPEAEVKY